MIPLRVDIWHNLERVFLAGISGDESEVEADRYYAPLFSSPLCYNITFHSGFTTKEKEVYARILELIPILVPVIKGCADKERPFEQFVKLVRNSFMSFKNSIKSSH
jgi:hypothetical protein